MKIVINKCYGGFGLSDKAYKKLIEWGIPVRKYIKEKRGSDGRYINEPLNEGKIIFDNELTPQGEDELNDMYYKYKGSRITTRYWETWIDEDRTNPLLIRVVEELGQEANGFAAELKIVEIPDGTDYVIDEYDGLESIHEQHQVWG